MKTTISSQLDCENVKLLHTVSTDVPGTRAEDISYQAYSSGQMWWTGEFFHVSNSEYVSKQHTTYCLLRSNLRSAISFTILDRYFL